MNHVEALKVARDALESIEKFSGSHIDIRSAREALAATAIIEPVAAVAASALKMRFIASITSSTSLGENRVYALAETLKNFAEEHCATQVAQWQQRAESAATQLVAQIDARNLAITERIEITKYCDDLRGQLAQALAAKPAPSELTSTDIIAAVDAAHARGRIALTHINNDGEEVPTDIAKCFTRALLSR